jgi:hypothetical protein
MNDENETRIIKPRREASNDANDGATKYLKEPEKTQDDEEITTRVISSSPKSRELNPDAEQQEFELTAGWLVVVDGPGRGCSCEVYYGMNSIGRNSSERIPLNFGDSSISREAHAYIVFDDKQGDFYIQHGGKSNLIRLNDRPVLAPESLKRGDTIEMGNTKLMFIPLCDENFSWKEDVV